MIEKWEQIGTGHPARGIIHFCSLHTIVFISDDLGMLRTKLINLRENYF